MSTFKVSIDFLEGPVPGIISKSMHIAKCMSGNANFPIPPVSPVGLQTAIEHLKKMQGKVKGGNGKDSAHRDEALADVDDYIRQEAEYVNHTSSYDLDKLLSSGFELLHEQKHTPVPDRPIKVALRNGKRPGEVIAGIDLVQHCKVAIGRISMDADFPSSSTTEVIGTSRTRVVFSALIRGTHVWIAVKCRGTNGDSKWSTVEEITIR
jgi:hypothetical protein